MSLNTGIVPDDWKMANMKPLHKKRQSIGSRKLSANSTHINCMQSDGVLRAGRNSCPFGRQQSD